MRGLLFLFYVVPLHSGAVVPTCGYWTWHGLPVPCALLCFFPDSATASPLCLPSDTTCVWPNLTAFHSMYTLVMLFSNRAAKSERCRVWLVEDGCIPPAFSWQAQEFHLVLLPPWLLSGSEPTVLQLLYSLSIVARTKYHKLGVQNSTNVLSYSYVGQKSNMSFTGLKSRARCFWRLKGRICFLSFPVSRDHHILWLVAPFSIFKVSSDELRPFHASNSSWLFFCFPFFSLTAFGKGSQLLKAWLDWVYQNNPEKSLHTKILNLLPCKATYSEVLGISMWTSLGAIILPTTITNITLSYVLVLSQVFPGCFRLWFVVEIVQRVWSAKDRILIPGCVLNNVEIN